MEEFKTVKCRQCGKEFQALITEFLRKGKPIKRHTYWCNSECYRAYLKDIAK